MSEVVHTRCDSCPTVISVEPPKAVAEHGWMEDDYGSHFCTACQQSAADLDASTADADEVQDLAEAINTVVKKPKRRS